MTCDALDDLTRLAIKTGTDKFGPHLYTPIYDKIFSAVRNKKLKILEVGVGGYGNALAGGLGLSMWAEYFPVSSIVGIDIQEKTLVPHPRIRTVQGSQVDTDFLDKVWLEHGPFDIVIDDGSHVPGHVLTTFRHLYPKLDDTGIYVVEDTQTSLWPHIGGRADAAQTIFELASRIGIAMHAHEACVAGGTPVYTEFGAITESVRVYRNLIVFERGVNDYPSNHIFDVGHESVEHIRSLIAEECSMNPSPGGCISAIALEWCGRRIDAGAALARKAVQTFPQSRELLVYTYTFFEEAGLTEDCRFVANRLRDLLPQDLTAKEMAAKYAALPISHAS